ncbi:hypothetical protein D3C72_1270210 [compost metagenome]
MRLAQLGTHAGQQFAFANRLGQVVVGAHVQGLHDALFVVALRQHQDGHVGRKIASRPLQDGQARCARHFPVQQHNVNLLLLQQRNEAIAVAAREGLVAVALQQFGDPLDLSGRIFKNGDNH